MSEWVRSIILGMLASPWPLPINILYWWLGHNYLPMVFADGRSFWQIDTRSDSSCYWIKVLKIGPVIKFLLVMWLVLRSRSNQELS